MVAPPPWPQPPILSTSHSCTPVGVFEPPQHRLRHMHQRLPTVIQHNRILVRLVAAAS